MSEGMLFAAVVLVLFTDFATITGQVAAALAVVLIVCATAIEVADRIGRRR